MSKPARIADRLTRQSAEQLVTMAGAVIAGLTNNPAFPNPTVDLKTLQAAADDLKATLAAQPHGGAAATAEKNNKQEALIVLLRKLKHYVEDNCENDPAVMLSSGFQAAASTHNSSPLANPSILSINPGNSTQLVLKVTRIARAKCYEVRSAPATFRGPGKPPACSRPRGRSRSLASLRDRPTCSKCAPLADPPVIATGAIRCIACARSPVEFTAGNVEDSAFSAVRTWFQ